MENIAPIINSLPELFSRILGIPKSNIQHLRDTCLPGIHIFIFARYSNTKNMTDFHKDRQHCLIEPMTLPVLQNAEFYEPLSFTLPLQLPSKGGGLILHRQSKRYNQISKKDEYRIAYESGRIVIHDGQNPHRIDDSYNVEQDDCRLTLQGHGLIVDNKSFYYYW